MKNTGLTLNFLQELATGLAAQFGDNCEVVIHDLTDNNLESSITIIENSHVSGRKVGDGPSQAALDALRGDRGELKNHLGYLTRTQDGRLLKSSTIYIRDENGDAVGIFGINYDITNLMMAQNVIQDLTTTQDQSEPKQLISSVNELLDELIEQSVRMVGKPVALMNKDDKIKAIQFLNQSGAFLITKSGDKVSKYFGISKYTLYSYIDAK